MTALTAVTIQNTQGVKSVVSIPANEIYNQIISDLYDNYLTAPRGGVVINLVGGSNAAPSGDALDLITILESNGWDIRSN